MTIETTADKLDKLERWWHHRPVMRFWWRVAMVTCIICFVVTVASCTAGYVITVLKEGGAL